MAAPLRWFPLYVDELESDERWRMLSDEQRGILIRLLCWQWREGAIAGDARYVAKLLHSKVASVIRVLELCFISEGTEDETVVNRKLAEIRVQQLQRAEKASISSRSWRTGEERYVYAATCRP